MIYRDRTRSENIVTDVVLFYALFIKIYLFVVVVGGGGKTRKI
jgi:hypothetical protein